MTASTDTPTLRGRDLLSAADLSVDEVTRVFDTAAALKAEFRATRRHQDKLLAGRTLAMLFQKPSLRTRVTFEAGMTQLGGAAIYLPEDAVMGAREAVRDVARNLERFVDAIVARTGPHEVVLELAAQASVPVINGLTLREHPCQALADVFTIREHLGRLDGAVITFVGDGNNVYHSLALVAAAFGAEVRLAHPAGVRARIPGSLRRPRPERHRTVDAWSSDTTPRNSSPAPISSTRTPGRRWARRSRPRLAVTRSRCTASTTPSWMPPDPPRWPCTACRRTAGRRSPRR